MLILLLKVHKNSLLPFWNQSVHVSNLYTPPLGSNKFKCKAHILVLYKKVEMNEMNVVLKRVNFAAERA